MNSKKYLPDLISQLSKLDRSALTSKIFVGYDGYIDKIQKAVKSRTQSDVIYFPTLTEFADRIARAAGKSGQIELVTHETKIGGNAPIMSNALGNLGLQTHCLGNGGYPVKNPEYENLHPAVNLLSVGDPSETNALEFNDGKLILSDLSHFRTTTWEQIKSVIDLKELQQSMDECEGLALVGWCNPDHATDIWNGILKDLMPDTTEKKLLFFDLADPTKKSREDLMEVLNIINLFTDYGPVTLGINENETLKLYDVLSDKPNGDKKYNLSEIGEFIFSKLYIDALLIHPVDRCILIQENNTTELSGKVVQEPKISTGGGDNLNAGYCMAKLLGLSKEESVILAMATSGSYVQNGKSSDLEAIIEYIYTW